MNHYNRYFKVTEGALIQAVKECRKINQLAREKYKEILKSVGASESYFVRENRLVAMTFAGEPDGKVFKRVGSTDNGWFPKKNCKAGNAH